MNRRLAAFVTSVSIAMLGPVAFAERTWATSVGAAERCAISPSTITTVLSVTEAKYFDGPQRMGKGTCSWRSTQPNCFVRSLSTTVITDPSSIRAVAKLKAAATPMDQAKVGTSAFFVHEDMGVGAAIAMESIYVKRANAPWVKLTLAGRIAPDGSRDLLLTAAQAVA